MKYAYDRMNIDVPGGIDWLHSSMHHSCLVRILDSWWDSDWLHSSMHPPFMFDDILLMLGMACATYSSIHPPLFGFHGWAHALVTMNVKYFYQKYINIYYRCASKWEHGMAGYLFKHSSSIICTIDRCVVGGAVF
ncbi:uncharacterized protein LOC111430674 isoform X2 [Cucurbita moschata]|uniref:Uncharacterized protein LOC111430674 isoform X2 n=1 Tax=Cucurbita moschata TaxID=3662 RepID=A0A6J1E4F3_CUCMO|nr:uncharacterized protein LOC111430674 isoform X2 [Cucurbita moschata]